jgi:hypothetical protein
LPQQSNIAYEIYDDTHSRQSQAQGVKVSTPANANFDDDFIQIFLHTCAPHPSRVHPCATAAVFFVMAGDSNCYALIHSQVVALGVRVAEATGELLRLQSVYGQVISVVAFRYRHCLA